MQNEKRTNWRGRTVPEIDEMARYQIKNLQFAPIQIQTKDPGENKLVSMILKRRETVIIHGSQMTNYIWDLEKRDFVKVDMLPAES